MEIEVDKVGERGGRRKSGCKLVKIKDVWKFQQRRTCGNGSIWMNIPWCR